jgi:myo-inositol-1(or 4)-monophosphatase
MQRYRRFAQRIAQRAGFLLKSQLERAHQIKRKRPIDLITEMDLRSQRLIVSAIRQSFPSHSILAEENEVFWSESPYRWIIDPLDGTTNYAHRLPIFCVSIALEMDGQIIVGVVYDPCRGELFWAEKGRGAFLNRKRIRVSRTPALSESLLTTGFSYDVRENPVNNLDHFWNFSLRTHAVRRLGSAALDLCYVAAGRFDGYWEMNLRPWDFAAGLLLVEEAGGKVTDFRGRAIHLEGKQVLATNGHIHRAMMNVLKIGKIS